MNPGAQRWKRSVLTSLFWGALQGLGLTMVIFLISLYFPVGGQM